MSMRYYISTEEASFFNNNSMGYGTGVPTSGTYKVGDFIISSKQENGIFGWVCVKAGTPGEWDVIGSGFAGGSGSGNVVVGYINSVSFNNTRNSIEIGIPEFNKGIDFLEVHYNGLLLAEGVHYNVSSDGLRIESIDGSWNESADDTQQMIFRVLKSEGVKVKEYKNTVDIDNACYEVEHGIPQYNSQFDIIEVHLNGVLLVEGLDYRVESDKLIKVDSNEAWNPYNVQGQKMFIKVMRNISGMVEVTDNSVGVDKLTPELAENIEAIDDLLDIVGIQNTNISNMDNRITALEEKEVEIDLSGLQSTSDNSLSTSNKTIVGAINELFQNANNGKELIASAIGEPLSSDDTFSAMSNDIHGLLSTFKTNMMNQGVTIDSGDKFKQLIDKIATLSDSEGKGLKIAEGIISNMELSTFVNSNSSLSETTTYEVLTNLDFTPTYIIVTNCDMKEDDANVYPSYNLVFMNEVTYQTRTSSGFYAPATEVSITDISKNKFNINLKVWFRSSGSGACTSTLSSTNNTKWYAIGVGEEDTTLRDSLAGILEDKGITVNPNDDMATLIGKVSLFDDYVPSPLYIINKGVIDSTTFKILSQPSGYSMTQNSDHILFNIPISNNSMAISSSTKFNLTNYSNIVVRFYASGGRFDLGINTTQSNSNYTHYVQWLGETTINKETTYKFNISDYNGEYYIVIDVDNLSASVASSLKIYDLYLEK